MIPASRGEGMVVGAVTFPSSAVASTVVAAPVAAGAAATGVVVGVMVATFAARVAAVPVPKTRELDSRAPPRQTANA